MRKWLLVFCLLPVVATAATPSPYALPMQLRPVAPGNVARLEDTVAFYDGGTSSATMALVSWKFHPKAAAFARAGFVNDFPTVGDSRFGVTNPLVGAMWGFAPHSDWKVAVALMATVPVGSGGGDTPNLEGGAALKSGIYNRSSMDNALFSPNDLTVIPGIDVAYVKAGLTIQAEATVLQLTRVKGDQVQPDSSKTNFTSGLFAGYYLIPQLSVGAELRYQRWLSTPVAVSLNDNLRDVMTVAVGVRGVVKLDSMVLRPGLSITTAIKGVPADKNYVIAQFDLPVGL